MSKLFVAIQKTLKSAALSKLYLRLHSVAVVESVTEVTDGLIRFDIVKVSELSSDQQIAGKLRRNFIGLVDE